MDRIVELLEGILDAVGGNVPAKPKRKVMAEDEKAARAYVAIGRGATTMAEIAEFLGVHRTTAERSPGVQRAFETMLADRTTDRDAGEEVIYEN